MTLDKAIKKCKKELNELIKDSEEELNKRDFARIYSSIRKYLVNAFTALLLKNNINPLEYMNEVPDCFAKALEIEKFRIPANVTSIGYWAFEDCVNLSSIEIPDGVTSIGDYAFYGCSNLTEIIIPSSVTSIGDYAFGKCLSLTEITIPNSVTSICYGVFSDCRELKSITIPDSITCINYSAFANCDRLKDVYYKGSKEDWKKIEINNDYDYNKSLLNANIHYNI